MIAFVAFTALLVFGLGMVDRAVAASGSGSCHCFDEPAAWQMCEELCSFFQGTSCLDVGPAGIALCNDYTQQCEYLYWSYCVGGGSFRRETKMNCTECEIYP